MWKISFCIAIVVLSVSIIASFVVTKRKHKKNKILNWLNIMTCGLVLSAIALFIPIYTSKFQEGTCGIFEALLISVHNTIRLFIVDGEFDFITDNLSSSDSMAKCYTVLFSILFVLAPALSFGFVMSFFKNFKNILRYHILNYNKDVYVFSELNEKSLALAESLYNVNPKERLIVFTDVFEKDEEKSYELIEKATYIKAICLKNDVLAVNFFHHSEKSEIVFFLIGDDQTENLNQTLKIYEDDRYKSNTSIYVFSSQVESELILSKVFDKSKPNGKKIRRINEIRSLVNRTLYDSGYEKIFCKAVEEGGIKKINAVIIGMGQLGTEMTKALTWFCQMDGYEVRIDSFDADEKAEDKFKSLCPELMDDEHNNKFDDKGDARYCVTIHPGFDVDTRTFDKEILKLKHTTYVLVALGNDEKNISVAVKLRALFGQNGYEPIIQAVVYNSDKKEVLSDIKNFKGEHYNIDFIGDMKSSYSEDVILNLEVEKKALARHMKWMPKGKEKWEQENEFWQYDYNYKSSIAAAIHYKMKCKCKIPGIEKSPDQRSEDELWNIRKLEHSRWNGYMRSEGYVYGGSTDKEKGRCDLAKRHNCLVPFDKLPPKEKEKDDD